MDGGNKDRGETLTESMREMTYKYERNMKKSDTYTTAEYRFAKPMADREKKDQIRSDGLTDTWGDM